MSAKDNNEPHASPSDAAEGNASVSTGVAVVGFILCFVAGIALMWGFDQRRIHNGEISADTSAGPSAGGAWDDSDSPVPISSKDPMWGKRDAPVTIVQFSDFQCPYCSRVEPTIDQVQSDVRTGQGPHRLEEQPPAFPPERQAGGRSGPGRVRARRERSVLEVPRHGLQEPGPLSTESYEKWAAGSRRQGHGRVQGGSRQPQVGRPGRRGPGGGKAAGVQGTPSFFINGVFINGAQPFDKFKTTIDQELQKAARRRSRRALRRAASTSRCRRRTRRSPTPAKRPTIAAKDDTTTVFKVPVGNSPALGSPNALVTIVEFSDFQCPFCARVEPTLKRSRDKYGDKVRLVWKNEPLPFHPAAEPAAEAAMEVRAEKGDKGFWAIHDTFFADQKILMNGQARTSTPSSRRQPTRAPAPTKSRRPSPTNPQEGHRRRPGPGRGLPGQRYAALLHQRPPPRGRAAAREVREDHRRGDQEGAGPHCEAAPSRARSTRR